MNNKYFFFWGHSGDSLKAKLSNFAKTPFKIKLSETEYGPVGGFDEVSFSTGEQAFHFLKAILFNDVETAKEILATEDPREQKKLGRVVKNFNNQTWNEHKKYIMQLVVNNKFTSDSDLKEFVCRKVSEGYTFVEASPYDRIWGIGYTESEAMENVSDWGENLLGKAITKFGSNHS